jgi:hypothetical protein
MCSTEKKALNQRVLGSSPSVSTKISLFVRSLDVRSNMFLRLKFFQ